MSDEQPTQFSQPLDTPRPDLDRLAGEREALIGMLEWHRATLAAKCDGLTDEELRTRSADPSTLSLHGLVRHLAAVERWWFQMNFAGLDVPAIMYTEANPDLDFDGTDGPFADDFAIWTREAATSREITDGAPDLDHRFPLGDSGKEGNLRWLLLHMIAEYARHNGHADLLRERLDGTTGY
jgi:uncharacterized damage-inducible protein DinB